VVVDQVEDLHRWLRHIRDVNFARVVTFAS